MRYFVLAKKKETIFVEQNKGFHNFIRVLQKLENSILFSTMFKFHASEVSKKSNQSKTETNFGRSFRSFDLYS